MLDIAIGPWGDSNDKGTGIHWKWKPKGPITRIEMLGNMCHVTSITFKSQNDSTTIGSYTSTQLFGFDLKPSEYLIGISGTWKEWGEPYNAKYFLSLSFETNLGNVSTPWPLSQGNPSFSYKAKDGWAITGFHGVYGCSQDKSVVDLCVNSIGIYEKPLLPSSWYTPHV